MHRTVIISDTHLGGNNQGAVTGLALRPLWQRADELIINGDAAELSDPKWRVHAARHILEIADLCERDGVQLTLLAGNHDPLVTDRRYLRLRGGEVFVTHGDLLHPAISPWTTNHRQLRSLHNDALASLGSTSHQRLEGQCQAVQHAENLKWEHIAEHGHGPKRNPVISRIEHGYKCARVLWFWHRLPRLAAEFARRYAPESRYFVFGHFHRAGVWRFGQHTIINTGSYHCPRRPHAVVIQGQRIEMFRVNFDPKGHTMQAQPRYSADLLTPASELPIYADGIAA
ncbi:MAG: metallophosphoesterase [Planctomycetota bacterium]